MTKCRYSFRLLLLFFAFVLLFSGNKETGHCAASEVVEDTCNSETQDCIATDSMTTFEKTSSLVGRTAIIIGAGPSGLSTALGLSKWCDKVFLVEKHSEFSKRGSNFGLAPNGLKALEELRPRTKGRMEEVSIVTPSGGMLVPWVDMRDVLLNLVQEAENVDLRTGEVFTEIVDDDNGPIKVTFESGLVLEGDFLIGADGVHSSVREWLKMPPGNKTGSRVFRGTLMVEEEEDNLLNPVLEKGLVPIHNNFGGVFIICFNFHSKIPRKLTWVLSTQQEVRDDMTPMELMEGKIEDEEVRSWVYAMFEQSDPVHLKPFRETVVIRAQDFEEHGWGGMKRVTLLGDASHAMRPTDGLGGSMAFEDAVILCRAFQEKDTIEKALRWYEKTRMPRVLKVHRNQEDRFMARMRGGQAEPWSEEFTKWVYNGV